MLFLQNRQTGYWEGEHRSSEASACTQPSTIAWHPVLQPPCQMIRNVKTSVVLRACGDSRDPQPLVANPTSAGANRRAAAKLSETTQAGDRPTSDDPGNERGDLLASNTTHRSVWSLLGSETGSDQQELS
jgi:hypothetical protein